MHNLGFRHLQTFVVECKVLEGGMCKVPALASTPNSNSQDNGGLARPARDPGSWALAPPWGGAPASPSDLSRGLLAQYWSAELNSEHFVFSTACAHCQGDDDGFLCPPAHWTEDASDWAGDMEE